MFPDHLGLVKADQEQETPTAAFISIKAFKLYSVVRILLHIQQYS